MAGPRTTTTSPSALADLLRGPVGLMVAAALDDRADTDEAAAREAGQSRMAEATVLAIRRAARVIRGAANGGDEQES